MIVRDSKGWPGARVVRKETHDVTLDGSTELEYPTLF